MNQDEARSEIVLFLVLCYQVLEGKNPYEMMNKLNMMTIEELEAEVAKFKGDE